MTILDIDPKSPNALATILKRVTGPFKVARKGGGVVVRQLPPTAKAAQAGTMAATSAVRRLSDSTLRWLAASSIGLGAGLYLSGKRRLTVAAGVAPAIVAGITIALRRDAGSAGSATTTDRPAELPSAGS